MKKKKRVRRQSWRNLPGCIKWQNDEKLGDQFENPDFKHRSFRMTKRKLGMCIKEIIQ